MKKIDNSKVGVVLGGVSGLTWGLDTVIVSVILTMNTFNTSSSVIFLAPFVSAFLRDTFSSIWMTLLMLAKGDLKKVLNAIKSKNGLVIAIGAILGGPIGMTCYILSVKYIGPGYTASISAIYPGIGAFLAFIFLKENLSIRTFSGVVLSVVGVFILAYSCNGGLDKSKFILGIIYALGSVLGWATESVICAYGMNDKIGPQEALNIRQVVSASVYGLVIIPNIEGSFIIKDIIFTNISIMLALSALISTASYLLWYKSIYFIGSARSTALNITYVVWAIIFQKLILNIQLTNQLIIGSIVIMLGAVLVSISSNEVVSLKS